MTEKIIPTIKFPVNLPTNSFETWTNSNEEIDIVIKFHYRDRKQFTWLTDAIRGNHEPLDDETLYRVINSWKCDEPVIISAQTGYGKNTFVSRVLVKKLFHESGYCKKILILSNRIALNRQNKLDFLNFLYELTHDDYFQNISEKFTDSGLDSLTDFKFVSLCSYHQLYELVIKKSNEKAPLYLKNFAYVVCDECHFFSSDAPFNVHTDEILKYIANNAKQAVRIYMSATIDEVFEPILRAESKFLTERFEHVCQQIQLQNADHIDVMNLSQRFSQGDYAWANSLSDVLENRQLNIEKAIEQERTKFSLNVEFFYISRDYSSYISDVHEYNNLLEVFDSIIETKTKTLVFVSKTFDGATEKELTEKFTAKNKKIAFLSREKISTNADCKKIYDKLISEKYFEENVLVSTSLLDNGIDVKDSQIGNIVIDVLDKTEFLQMLGRVRPIDDQKINLFVPNYELAELKKMFEQKIQQLVTTLYMETLDAENQQNFYEYICHNALRYGQQLKKFKFTKNPSKPYAYNEYAIYKMVSSAKTLLKLIKKSEQNYTVKLSNDDTNRLFAVRHYYINGDGYHKAWSRAVIDLLETDEGMLERQKIVYQASKFTIPDEREKISQDYEIKLNDDFEHFFCKSLIPTYFNKKIEQKIEQLKKFNEFAFDRESYGVTDSFRKLKILKELLAGTLTVDISQEENFYNLIQYYARLVDDENICSSSEEISRWLEIDFTEQKSTATENSPLVTPYY